MTEIFTEESNDNMEYDSSMKENTDNSNENNLEKNKIVVEMKEKREKNACNSFIRRVDKRK